MTNTEIEAMKRENREQQKQLEIYRRRIEALQAFLAEAHHEIQIQREIIEEYEGWMDFKVS